MEIGDNTNAITVNNVCYAYHRINKSEVQALDNCSVNVPCGIIYALLGPSGCGKTTLLRCILDRIRPHNGTIKVFGCDVQLNTVNIPGHGVGYMPQELSLIHEFTIDETLNYYGQMMQMTQKKIRERIRFFIKLFDLPNNDRMIKHLSGGQQRRVSLAVALLHEPPLLILDEPTVGTDSLMRQIIWQHLKDITIKNETTVIIVTHYTEEARNATICGLMRKGNLLEESEPNALMDKHQCQTIEEIFFKLSHIQDSNEIEKTSEKTEINFKMIIQRKVKHIINTSIHWYQFPILIKYNMNKMIRDWFMTLIAIFIPTLTYLIFISTIGRLANNVPVAIINEEVYSNTSLYAHQLLSSLPSQNIKQIKYDSLQTAINAVKDGIVWSVIQLNSNYSYSLDERFEMAQDADNDTIRDSSVHLYIDLTSPIVGFTVMHSLIISYQNVVRNLFTDKGYNPFAATVPIEIKEVIYGHDKPRVTETKSPEFVMLAIYAINMAFAATIVIREKELKVIERKLITGIGITEMIISHLITHVLIAMIQITIALLLFQFFSSTIVGRTSDIALIFLMQSVVGITLGILISVVSYNQLTAGVIMAAALLTNYFISGIMWPLESLPTLVMFLAHLTPVTPLLNTFKCLAIRGWSLWGSLWSFNLYVLWGFIVGGFYSISSTIVSLFIFNWITSP